MKTLRLLLLKAVLLSFGKPRLACINGPCTRWNASGATHSPTDPVSALGGGTSRTCLADNIPTADSLLGRVLLSGGAGLKIGMFCCRVYFAELVATNDQASSCRNLHQTHPRASDSHNVGHVGLAQQLHVPSLIDSDHIDLLPDGAPNI
jgi:hypothetical protein